MKKIFNKLHRVLLVWYFHQNCGALQQGEDPKDQWMKSLCGWCGKGGKNQHCSWPSLFFLCSHLGFPPSCRGTFCLSFESLETQIYNPPVDQTRSADSCEMSIYHIDPMQIGLNEINSGTNRPIDVGWVCVHKSYRSMSLSMKTEG